MAVPTYGAIMLDPTLKQVRMLASCCLAITFHVYAHMLYNLKTSILFQLIFSILHFLQVIVLLPFFPVHPK